MKAKLGELQARLDSHEGRRPQHLPLALADSTANLSTTSQCLNPPFVNTSVTQVAGTGAASDSPPSTFPATVSTPSNMQTLQSELYEKHAQESGSPLYHKEAPFLGGSSSCHSPPPFQQLGLLSPPARPAPERPAKVSQHFMLDCLRFQSQLLGRLNRLQNEAMYPAASTLGQQEGIPPSRSSIEKSDT